MSIMRMSRFLAVACAVMAAGSSIAISGPVPLAWRFWARTSTAPIATPALSGDTLIVPIGRRVYALNASTGQMIWMFPPGDEPDGEFTASPGIAGDIAILPNGNRFVYAVKVSDGTRAWSYSDASTVRHILTADGIAYLFTTDDRIVAINTNNGTRAWSSDLEVRDGISGIPILADGHLIFFTSRGTLTSFNVTTQRQAWSVGPMSTNFDGGPVLYGGFLYIVTGQQVARINPRNGQPMGRPLMAPERLDAGAAVTSKGGVVLTSNNKMFLFDHDLRQWRGQPVELKGYLRGTPQAVGDNVVVRATNGAIYLIDPSRTEQPVVWEYTTLPIPGTTRAASTSGGSSGGAGLSGGGGGALGGGGGLQGGGGRTGGGAQGGGGGATQTVLVDYLTILGGVVGTQNALYALAEDGSVFAWSKDVGVDQVGPKIVLMSPPAGTSMNGQPDIDFLFRLEDEGTGVMARSIRVTMNDQPMNFEYEPGGGFLRVKIRLPGSTVEGANPPLNDGRKVFVVRATDWMGNTSEQSFIINIDNALPKTTERTVDDRRSSGGGGTTGGPGIG